MVECLEVMIDDFPGASNQTRCFLHILNLVVKSILKQFDLVIVTGNPGVTARDLYPTRGNPYPSTWVGVFAGRGRGLAVFIIIITTGCRFTQLL